MNEDQFWLRDRTAFLSSSPPRVVPVSISKAAGSRGALGMRILGGAFLLLGLALAWAFFPERLHDEWKLKQGPVETAHGTIVAAEKTSLSLNKVKVYQYEFSYRPDSGQIRKGTAYTTGSRWNGGENVSVRFLASDPSIAAPVGARLGKSTPFCLLVLVFPVAGGALLIFSVLAAQRNTRILQNGNVATATVDSLEKTNVQINNQNVYKIRLTRMDNRSSILKRSHDESEIALLEEKRKAGEPVTILFDPDKPKHLLFPEAWKFRG